MKRQGRIPPELDELVDKVLSYDPNTKKIESGIENKSIVESWSSSIEDIFNTGGLRLDATHFHPKSAGVLDQLKNSGIALEALSDLATVELRNQFTRIWAEDEKHGLRYINATDLLSLLSLGVPAGGPRFLSHSTETNIDALIIRKGWLLMTCSGTIGRVFYVPARLDGWVATHDLIRIIPKETEMAGYLYAWLTTPIAQAQILSHTHGGQIDHVTDTQASEILVPRLNKVQIHEINKKVIKALNDRERSMDILINAWPNL